MDMLRLIPVLIILGTTFCASAQQQGISEKIHLETSGATKDNRGEDNKEFYEQTRTLLLGLSIGKRSIIQMGVAKSRIGNEEILEFPLLFRYQASERISTYAGAQIQLFQALNNGDGASFNGFAPTIGVDVKFSPYWDGGVQFVMPTRGNSAAPQVNYERSQLLRLRTGIKF